MIIDTEKPNQFYNMDCMEGMKHFPDKYFELAIVDPPYGIGESGDKNCTRSRLAKATNYKSYYGNDLEAPPVEFFLELMRVSKHQIIFGANHFISRIPIDSSCWVVWDKENGANDFADCELAWTSFKTAVRKFRYRWQGMLQENMKNKTYITYIATALSIAGTVANSFKKRWCFYIWGCTNLFWCIYNAYRQEYALALQYLFNLAMSAVGLWQWKKKERK